MMFIVSPIIPLILSIFLTIIIVRDSIVKHQFYKYPLTITFIVIFISAILTVFYNEICEDELSANILNYFLLALSIVISFAFLFVGLYNVSNNELNKKILDSFTDNLYYLYVNKKGKIVAISEEMKKALGIDSEIINIKDVFSKYITIKSINNEEANNKEFLAYILTKIDEASTHSFNISFYSNEGALKEISLKEEVIIVKGKFAGRMFLGKDDKITTNTINVENDSLLSERLNILLNPKLYGLLLHDLKEDKIWLNDYIVDKLNLNRNNLDFSEYSKLINKDDYNHYLDLVDKTTETDHEFETYYRIAQGKKVCYLKEYANVVYSDNDKSEIISYVIISDTRNFMTTNTILDTLLEEEDLNEKITELANQEENYELVYFSLLNIPSINEEYGRKIGTMLIEEYVKTFSKVFSDLIYRISGLEFGMVITDIQKMELFKKTLLKGKIFNPNFDYGSINCNLDVVMGISFSNDSIRPNEIYLNSKFAMKKAIELNKPYLFYKDIVKERL